VQRVDDEVAVDGVGDRLAHADVVERLAAGVEGEPVDRPDPLVAAGGHLQPIVRLEPADALALGVERQHVPSPASIDRTSVDGSDDADDDPVEVGAIVE
jgi:hypothetical protein